MPATLEAENIKKKKAVRKKIKVFTFLESYREERNAQNNITNGYKHFKLARCSKRELICHD